jgi:hypothetical protein
MPARTYKDILPERGGENKSLTLRWIKEKAIFKMANLKKGRTVCDNRCRFRFLLSEQVGNNRLSNPHIWGFTGIYRLK